MDNHTKSPIEEARSLGARLGVHWTQINLEHLRNGVDMEQDHGVHSPKTNVTDELVVWGKSAWAQLKDIWDYYTRPDQRETESQCHD